MSNQWVLPVLLAAVVGSAATATGFMLGRPDDNETTTPVAVPEECSPVACEPVACEPVACEPVACVEPVVEDPPSRTRRRHRGTTHQVLNPWDNDPTPSDSVDDAPPPPAPATMREPTKVLDPWN